MNEMPLAGGFCATREGARQASRFPLTWVQCDHCRLVQVLEDVPDELLFSKYNYASSTVQGLVRHFTGFAQVLAEHHGHGGPLRYLEIGCNDGVLLKRLPAGWDLVGVDPSDVAAEAARSTVRYKLHQTPFSTRFVTTHDLQNSFDVISGSNCLAHISDLEDVFQAAYSALRIGGHFWVEVHDLDALLNLSQWDTIYHEHKAEWSAESLRLCLSRLGFEHLRTDRVALHGGLLRACYRKGSQPRQNLVPSIDISERLMALRTAYARRYDTAAVKLLRAAQKAGKRAIAYGAAGRATVYLNQLPELEFEYVVDESPLRSGKFIPGVATPIVPLACFCEDAPALCLVTAWNYKDDIIRKHPAYTGEWLTAFE